MKTAKCAYNVYRRYVDMSDDGYFSGYSGEWQWMGRTVAVSEAKALNNVQFRVCGDGGHNHGRYRIEGFTHHTAAIPEWKAVKMFSAEDKQIFSSIKRKNKK